MFISHFVFLKPRNKHIIFTSQVSQKCDPILVMVDIVSPSERNCQDTRQQTFQQKYTNKGFMQSGKKKKKKTIGKLLHVL